MVTLEQAIRYEITALEPLLSESSAPTTRMLADVLKRTLERILAAPHLGPTCAMRYCFNGVPKGSNRRYCTDACRHTEFALRRGDRKLERQRRAEERAWERW